MRNFIFALLSTLLATAGVGLLVRAIRKSARTVSDLEDTAENGDFYPTPETPSHSAPQKATPLPQAS